MEVFQNRVLKEWDLTKGKIMKKVTLWGVL
jgi:hypothetical protein